jgi:hypothetical protein
VTLKVLLRPLSLQDILQEASIAAYRHNSPYSHLSNGLGREDNSLHCHCFSHTAIMLLTPKCVQLATSSAMSRRKCLRRMLCQVVSCLQVHFVTLLNLKRAFTSSHIADGFPFLTRFQCQAGNGATIDSFRSANLLSIDCENDVNSSICKL